MSIEIANDLDGFRRFLDEQVESGRGNLTPEKSLELWRLHLQELREGVAAVQEALAEMDMGGAGTPLAQFVDDFRRRHNIDPGA